MPFAGLNSDKPDSSESVSKTMKVLMVACISLLSQAWGKYYLIKTKHKVSPNPYKYEAGMDYSQDGDDKSSKAETKIYKEFTKKQLDEFENKLSADKQGELIKLFDKVIDNLQHVKEEGADNNLDIIEKIKRLTSGLENLLSGVYGILGLVDVPMHENKNKKPMRCKNKSWCKKYKKYNKPRESRG